MFGWSFVFEFSNIWDSHGMPQWGDMLGLVLSVSALAMTIVSWPIVIEVSNEGLKWHRLLIKRYIPWREVEDVNTNMDGGLVVYISGDRRIDVGRYTEGRPELKKFIAQHAQGQGV